MKKFICFVFILSTFLYTVFANGRKDREIPSEDIEIALKGDENSSKIEYEQKYTLREPEGNPINLQESLGYVMQSRLEEYDNSIPLTDVCFFSAEINCYGELTSIPARSRINTGKARCHLVIACDSKSLTHFILTPGSKVLIP